MITLLLAVQLIAVPVQHTGTWSDPIQTNPTYGALPAGPYAYTVQPHDQPWTFYSIDNAHRFDGDHWEPGPHGLPILKGVTAWMVGTIVARTPVAANAMIAVQIDEGALGQPDEPLLYHERSYRALGAEL